ncbi:hypothetical protein QUF49_14615 [Fictibacillus sp. b24]|uniref:hypothetical protein n=1 Tax=Fictibacillus sp. b24 TaxID=3055863 RepID=UPI0025A17866|nr:hypothetical protein [Fictibacillus sp. b24]MDM5317239.1 hypothetical protein [Fictibacillus sp. b24]
MRVYLNRCIVSLVASLFFIFLVDLFTQKPGRLGGNGNLGLIPLFFAIMIIAYSGYVLLTLLKKLELNRKKWTNILAASFLVFIVSIVMEIFFFKRLIHELGGPPTTMDSQIYRFGWLNQGTNTLYVNMYTFIAFVSLILSCYAALSIFKETKLNE